MEIEHFDTDFDPVVENLNLGVELGKANRVLNSIFEVGRDEITLIKAGRRSGYIFNKEVMPQLRLAQNQTMKCERLYEPRSNEYIGWRVYYHDHSSRHSEIYQVLIRKDLEIHADVSDSDEFSCLKPDESQDRNRYYAVLVNRATYILEAYLQAISSLT